MPPPQAVYEYYDENYYYEMVVPQKEEVAETTMPPDADLYNRRQKRDKIVQDLQSHIARWQLKFLTLPKAQFFDLN